jgi:hypothetical protein
MKKLKTTEANQQTTKRPPMDPKDQDKKHFKMVSPTAVFEHLELKHNEEGTNDQTRSSRFSFDLQTHISSAD